MYVDLYITSIMYCTHSCLGVLPPVCVYEAGPGGRGPGPAQVTEPQRGAYEHGDPAGPDGVTQVQLREGGQLMLHHHHTVDLLHNTVASQWEQY